MGVLATGLLPVSVFKLDGPVTLADLQAASSVSKYSSSADKPGHGWGSIFDDPGMGLRADSSDTAQVGSPAILESHSGMKTLAMRLYFDVPVPTLRKRLGTQADWRLYHQRQAMDILVMTDTAADYHTVAVTSRKERDIENVFKKAATELLTHAKNAASTVLKSVPITEEADPDLFLWLFYKHNKGQKLLDDLALGSLDQIHTRGGVVGWRSHYSQGASGEREEILVHVAKGDSFGPAKLGLSHLSAPEGFFEFKLELDGGFTVYRSSEYDDEDLSAAPPLEVARHMVEDIWQIILPKMRSAHSADSDWKATLRTEFVEYAKTTLHAI